MTDVIALMKVYGAAKDDLESYAFMPATDATLKAYNSAVEKVNGIRRRLRKEIKKGFGFGAMDYWDYKDDDGWNASNPPKSKYRKLSSIDDAWKAYVGRNQKMSGPWVQNTNGTTTPMMLNQVNQQLAQMIQAAQTSTTTSVFNPNVVITPTSGTSYITNNTVHINPRTYISTTTDQWDDDISDYVRRLRVGLGHKQTITMPDDTVIEVEKDGSYKIIDKDAKVKYKANPTRDFNSYVNASDKIEEFIKFCGKAGVKQDEMLKLPLELFIYFLVIEAARADKEPDPELPLMPALLTFTKPRCSACGRFLARKLQAAGLMFDRATCYERKMLSVNPKLDATPQAV